MTTFTISGSFDSSTGAAPLGSYQVCVYGTGSMSDTGQHPITAIYNAGTGSINLSLKHAKIGFSPKGSTQPNDVTFLLGRLASGSISGTSFAPTALDPSYPVSQAMGYINPSGLTIGSAMNGTIAPSQASNEGGGALTVVVALLEDNLVRKGITIPPGQAYVITLSEVSVPDGATAVAFMTEFHWDEIGS